LILICDENVGPRVTEALRLRGYEALSFHDLGWLGEADEVWLPKATLIADSLVITRDRTILEKDEELAALTDNSVGVVLLTGGQLPTEIMVEVLTANWEQLEELHNNTPRPFVRFLTTTGNLRERLHGRSL
jgi:predicted nuclease of predicted toxin-antitoxin system